MSATEKSVLGFGLYAVISGLGLFLIPDLLLSILRVEVAETVWIRIIGFMLFEIGLVYIWAVRAKVREVFEFSVYIRIVPVTCLVLLVVLAGAPFQVLLFAFVDAASALHTWVSLKRERNEELAAA
ncbi:MAG: hypothetical protein AAFP99_02375 [Pseudomonadota bacterium]